jgi:putative addiction module component (TIGR02574 family)
MSKEAQAVLDSALKLSDEEREVVLVGLLDSFPDEELTEDTPEFQKELRRRIAEVENGTVKTIPWEVGRQMILDDIDVVPH